MSFSCVLEGATASRQAGYSSSKTWMRYLKDSTARPLTAVFRCGGALLGGLALRGAPTYKQGK